MVQNYTADLKHTLWSLQSAGSLPPFPKPKWKNVLSGMAVNFDAIFSGLFSTLADDKITTSIGDFDLSIGSSKPSKVIQSHGDWTITWNATASAISVVSAQAGVFAKNLTKIGQILRIFDELNKIKIRWVLC